MKRRNDHKTYISNNERLGNQEEEEILIDIETAIAYTSSLRSNGRMNRKMCDTMHEVLSDLHTIQLENASNNTQPERELPIPCIIYAFVRQDMHFVLLKGQNRGIVLEEDVDRGLFVGDNEEDLDRNFFILNEESKIAFSTTFGTLNGDVMISKEVQEYFHRQTYCPY